MRMSIIPSVVSAILLFSFPNPAHADVVFTVSQKTALSVIRPQNLGFGMLASYNDGGPGQVRFARTAVIPSKEVMHPFCLALVYSPTGDLVASYDFTDQAAGLSEVIVNVPAGPAGIYRFSITGGRDGESVGIDLPQPVNWGVEGEVAYVPTTTTPSPAYLYLPRTVTTLYVSRNGWGTGLSDLTISSSNNAILATITGTGTKSVTINAPGADTVVRLAWSGTVSNQILYIEGTPPLLCPSSADAWALKGGVQEASGRVVSNPLSARARNQAVAIAQNLVTPAIAWPALPVSSTNAWLESTLWGGTGPLSGMNTGLAAQVLDPTSPYLGAQWTSTTAITSYPSWENFIPGPLFNLNDACGYAAAYSCPGDLNPLYHVTAIRDRATLAAFYQFSCLLGGGFLRDSSLTSGNTLTTNTFFSYDGNLAQPLYLLRDQLPADIYATWKQCLMAVGDRYANAQFYESNQWSHILLGHLHTYLATDEPRFLEYFERQANAFADNAYGPNSKFGQHPAGFYLEEYGPDGNYDHLSSFLWTETLYIYQNLPEASPPLVAKIKAMIQKNLEFKRFYWNPQPNGSIPAPTGFNCRTMQQISQPTWPGDFLAGRDFDLGYTLWSLTKPTGSDHLYPASISPFLANTPSWALAALKYHVGKKGDGNTSTSIAGDWVPALRLAFAAPYSRTPSTLPNAQPGGVWELPGHIAFNQAGIYGTVFYDVAVATTTLAGNFGGGPTLFWTADAGLVAASMRNLTGTVTGLSDLTHSCVYGTTATSTVWSGKERATLQWIVPNQIFEIHTTLAATQSALTWRYTLLPDAVRLQVILEAKTLTTAGLNLPFYQDPSTPLSIITIGSVTQCSLGGTGLEFVTPSGITPVVTDYIQTRSGNPNYGVRILRVPLNPNGTNFETSLLIRRPGGGVATTFPIWAYDHGLAGSLAAPNATPASDGVPNLIKYGLNIDPLVNSPSPITAEISGTQLQLSYLRARGELTYSVENSTDLVSWNTTGVTQDTSSAVGSIATATIPFTTTPPRHFVRLRISMPN